jgi:precorrin-6B methylase 2
MENVNFVNMHRYQAIERIVYNKVLELKPKTIVELGHGSGALTVAMSLALRDSNTSGVIHSYDINGTKDYTLGSMKESAINNIKKRGLSNYVKFTKGDVFKTFVSSPFHFDLILIDINNTWDILYKILINNEFINNVILNGAKILVEGGDPNHPRIHSKNIINPFKITHLGGSGRTSISNLEL